MNNDLVLLEIALNNLKENGIMLLNDNGTANDLGIEDYILVGKLGKVLEEIMGTSRTQATSKMKDLGLENDTIVGATANINISKVADSYTIDSKKLQAEDPATYDKYKKVKKGYETLKVSPTGKKTPKE